ncbi:MAG: hypothetical protein JRC86_03185 [Deltaproteobacteria bacterium]|nr:hypothetical protein [Deltaproteobacteria bacterium]
MKYPSSDAEQKIIDLYEGLDEPSIFQIASQLGIPPEEVYPVIRARCSPLNQLKAQKALNAPKETTMAKKDKNKAERDKTMASLREGTPVYGIDMDSIRGLLPEMEQGECFIIQKQGASDKVSMRLGDVSYS